MNNDLLNLLYRQYYKEIYLYLYSMSRNRDTAEDLTQDTFLKAILSLQDSHTNMRAWLYEVARNLYFNSRKKHDAIGQGEELTDEIADENIEQQLDKILAEERSGMLRKALDSLEDRYREVLILQYFENMSQKDIAAILRVSPENVRILSFRGKKMLKQKLEEMNYEL